MANQEDDNLNKSNDIGKTGNTETKNDKAEHRGEGSDDTDMTLNGDGDSDADDAE